MINTPMLDELMSGRKVQGQNIAPIVSNKPDTPVLDNLMNGKDSPLKSSSGLTDTISVASQTEDGRKKLSKWQWVGKQLMKPVGTVAAESEAFGKFLGTGEAYTPGKAGLDILTGKKESSFAKTWRTHAAGFGISESTAGKIGFVLDLTSDPFMFLGIGGLTKAGRLAAKVSSLKKAGQIIKVGSKLDKQIIKSGYTVDELILAATKTEQAAKGQRALVSALGKPIVKGTNYYKGMERLGAITKASKLGEITRRTFSDKTGIKELDELIDNFSNLSSHRKQKVIEQAGKIEKQIKRMNPDDVKLTVDLIERPLLVTRKTITDARMTKASKIASEIEDLFVKMKKTEGKKGIIKTELEGYFPNIKAKLELGERIKYFFNPKQYNKALKEAKGRAIEGTISDINARFGKEFFESNPTISYAQRGLASAKAVTAKEFLGEAGERFFINAEDAPIHFIESSNPILKGLKAEPEIAKAVDRYIQGIEPEELQLAIRAFDNVQGWWKAQVLISPSYHLRNMVGNFWNNWLAGVKNPLVYEKARKVINGKDPDSVILVTDAGKILKRKQILEGAKKRNVIGQGQYGADIEQALADEIGGRWKGIISKDAWKPWKQEFALIKTNRAVGSAIEDNARMAHYIDKLKKGFSADDAARSVKKFLFDYEDLSKTEKNLFKRLLPFYTWTRKNLPLQVENLIMQPEKYAALFKVQEQIEAGVADPATQKYMSDYITENIPVKIRTNDEGDTEYFLMGNWLPAAAAIDVLSNPIDTLIKMTTPFLKIPYEQWANKSMFFKNTLGESSKIETYHKQPTEFINITMRAKTASLVRNIRILNDINKLIKTPAKNEPKNSWIIKSLSVLFGNASTYDIQKAKFFYDRDTQDRIGELKAAIKKAQRMGDKKYMTKLNNELREFRIERGKR